MSCLTKEIDVAMGAKIMMGVRIIYKGLEEQETLMDMEIIFFVNPQNLEADYFWVFGTVELENSL